jgi:signal transduction histidine kinase
MDAATALTHTKLASILLVNQRTGLLHFTASTHDADMESFEVPMKGSIAGWVVQNGESVIIDDAQSDDRFYASVDEALDNVTHSMIAVPLITQTGAIGALEVLNKIDGNPYSKREVALLETLASQAAVAITNAYLFDQSDLLAEVMHEIKTPLMALTSASELLSRPELPEEQQTAVVGMIQRETKRLSRMTKDFLDLARLESGRDTVQPEPICVREIISDVYHITKSQAAKRGIKIKIEPGDGGRNRQIVGDADKIKQVMLNLVSNAIKYNRENGRVTISSYQDSEWTYICVTDTGMGISDEDLQHLFKRFYRIPGSDAEGTGLGLSIARQIIEAHNGRIQVKSTVGTGTTFTISLPYLFE